MNRIEQKFKELKSVRKKAFIAFITAGYPNLSVTENLVKEFDAVGVDIVELGVPFTDPMADGPIIQEASQHALKHGVRLADILNLVENVRAKVNLPICLMTYFNPVFCFGQERFVKEAVGAGVDGVVIPDLPFEESKDLLWFANRGNLDVIQFLAPTSTMKRIKMITRAARGFIYYVSLTGTTGARKTLPQDLKENLLMIKKHTGKPVCAGFGISTSAQVKEISRVCDGVIVGSAIVKKIKENIGSPDLVRKTGSFIKALKG